MGQDFWRAERETEPRHESGPSVKQKPDVVLESDWREYSWEKYIDELRRKYESVSDA
jgi:hypothetical protein